MSQILSQLRPDRQTLLFSATLSERLEVACGSWLKAPVRIYADQRAEDGESRGDESPAEAAEMEAGAEEATVDVGGGEGERLSAVSSRVEQRFVMCSAEGGRSAALLSVLSELGHASAGGGAAAGSTAHGRNLPRVMVFVNEIRQLKKLAASLKKAGVRCESLHGEKSQRERDESMRLFRAGAAPVLVTSDLASRGIDIPKLPAVVNFDPPPSATQYVHRAGRTGRQGAAGLVVSLVRRDDASRHLAVQLRGMLERTGNALPPELLSLLPPDSRGRPAPAVAKLVGGRRKRPRSDAAQQRQPPVGPDESSSAAAACASFGGDLLDFAQAVGNM